MRRITLAIVAVLAAVGRPAPAGAGCGCDKPPPPRAAVRPFVGYADQKINLFDDRLVPGQRYAVEFESRADGSVDWSRGRAAARRDFADGQVRPQLRVGVGSVSLGPCRVSVWTSTGALLFALDDSAFTVAAAPIPLHDFDETVSRTGYQAGVGADGTVYIPVDVSQVNEATTFTGQAIGFPVHFGSDNVAMYNEQGFLMQLLDPRVPGLFRMTLGAGATSDALSYWRHEFRSYKRDHRAMDARRTDDDPDWHADGSYHVDHDRIVVAVHPTMADGMAPAPGATPPFALVVTSSDVALQ
jgi:hypothetical protein